MKPRSLLAGLVLAAIFATPGRAQCPLNDGLDGILPPCASPNLTVRRQQFQQPALGICWWQCNVDATAGYTAVWSKFTKSSHLSGTTDCGWYITNLRLYQGLVLRWQGRFNVHYARTWMESGTTPGTQVQVWRFLLNGDMRPYTFAPGPCATPPCAPPNFWRVRFTGYVDFARDCATGLIDEAWMITHACDLIDHDTGYARGGTFHPDRYYTFVGPAAGFVPGPTLAQEIGFAPNDTVRAWVAGPIPVMCQYEEPATANFNPISMNCLCSVGAPMWYDANVAGSGVAGTSFMTVAAARPFQSVAIGAWTNPAVYPGNEELRWNTAQYLYRDACTANMQLENFFGVTTLGGNPAFWIDNNGVLTSLPTIFVDQSNSKVLPGLGAPQLNVMYRSDHVICLNL
jgi:hypothetical protein